jgi:hypothetical protein
VKSTRASFTIDVTGIWPHPARANEAAPQTIASRKKSIETTSLDYE